MKVRKPNAIIVTIFAGTAAALFIAGCASVGSGNTTSLLSAAGFRVRTPQTPKQQQIYAALPPYKVERATVNGHVFYVYKDEKAGVAYIGREHEYQNYQQPGYSAADCSELLHSSGNGPCSCLWVVRGMGSTSVLVVTARS